MTLRVRELRAEAVRESPKAPGPVLPSPFTVKALRLSALSMGVWIEWN